MIHLEPRRRRRSAAAMITLVSLFSISACRQESTALRMMIEADPGSAFYYGKIAAEAGSLEAALPYFEATADADRDPWRLEAIVELARLHASRGDDFAAIAAFRRGLEAHPEDRRLREGLRRVLYRRRDFATLATELDEGPGDPLETAFYRVLVARYLGDPEWLLRKRDLYLEHDARSLARLELGELDLGRDEAHLLSAWEAEFFLLKAAIARKDYGAAWRRYEAVRERLRTIPLPPATLRDLGELHLRAGRYREGLAEFRALLGRAAPETRHLVLEYTGKFRRRLGQFANAMADFREAARVAPGPSAKDRVLWYLLQAGLRVSTDTGVALLPEISAAWAEPTYFSDILEGLANVLVQRRRWLSVERAYAALKGRAAPEDAARFGFILAVAVRGGLHRPVRGSATAGAIYRAIVTSGAAGYYGILARAALGLAPVKPPTAEPGTPSVPGPEELFFEGLLDFGLSAEAYRRFPEARTTLSTDVLARLAEDRATRGDYLESLRVASYILRERRGAAEPPSRNLLELAYPRAFAGEMDSVIAEYDLPPAVFYGLVREESHFDPGIRSRVGAAGLAQLMPGTADDIADRLRLTDPDLEDPRINLRLGGFYLSRLIRRFESGALALAAYNAGQGRVSRWRGSLRGLPEVLYPEAFPVLETRDYLRKILVSAVYYEALYGSGDGPDVVSFIFRDFGGIAP